MKQLRVQVAETSRFLHDAGWCANHDGNVTARDGNRYIATPTATSKRLVAEKDLIEVDGKGQVIGRGKVFGEIGLHLVVYERRPDVGAVVHAHPPYATAISASRGNPIERPFIAEALVSLGPVIPKLPYAQPGDAAKQALAPWCELVDAVHPRQPRRDRVGQGLRDRAAPPRARRAPREDRDRGGAARRRRAAARVRDPAAARRAREGRHRPRRRSRARDRAAAARPRSQRARAAQKPVVACAPAPHSEGPDGAAERRQSRTISPSSCAKKSCARSVTRNARCARRHGMRLRCLPAPRSARLGCAHRASGDAATPTRRRSSIELFTSQGCSSCPPADALLDKLARDGAVARPRRRAARVSRRLLGRPRLGRSVRVARVDRAPARVRARARRRSRVHARARRRRLASAWSARTLARRRKRSPRRPPAASSPRPRPGTRRSLTIEATAPADADVLVAIYQDGTRTKVAARRERRRDARERSRRAQARARRDRGQDAATKTIALDPRWGARRRGRIRAEIGSLDHRIGAAYRGDLRQHRREPRHAQRFRANISTRKVATRVAHTMRTSRRVR